MGFSKEQIGLLTALRPWLSAISGNVFAVAADHLAAHKPILLATYAATALLRFSLSLPQSFGLTLVLVVLMEVCNSPINIIVDAAVMGAGGEREYGRARLWGAVGWGCLAPAAGAVVAHFGIRAAFTCNIALAALGLVPTVLLPIGALRKQRPSDAASGGPEALEKPQLHRSSINVHADSAAPGSVSANRQAVTPSAGVAAADLESGEAGLKPQGEAGRSGLPAGTPAGTAHDHLEETVWEVAAHVPLISAPELLVYDLHTPTFLFLFLDELGGSELLMGLTITITCIAEVPVFFFTGWLLEAVGVKVVLHGVLAVYILRLGYYSILEHLVTPWAVLPIELLHGVTFGLAWAAGTINCSRISPPGLETTTQAIFQGLFSGVGLGLGGLIGGVIYNNFGAPTVFASAALVLAVGWCLCITVQALTTCLGSYRSGK
ncbi:hypothetical protein WJX81_007525 [Elliptochloris bilobata]|uniref:Major facilitator superfamily associated domain-containing protein n=1 Tax=Elliptochloris bilobata TaxID=381761 RepID=A0AAW1RFU2_9CHLO